MAFNRLARHFFCAAAAATAMGTANAAVVLWSVNLAVPSTSAGLYLNIATQTTSSTPIAGWDINPYGATSLNFFASSAAPNPPSTYMRLEAGGGPSSLGIGVVVGPSSTFVNNTTAVVSGTNVFNGWQLNAINYFGFRFNHEGLGGIRYGFGVMQVGATSGSRTLVSVLWEDSGGAIAVIPAPGALAVGVLSGLAGRSRSRRR